MPEVVVGSQRLQVAIRGNVKSVPIPYVIPLEAVVFVGVLYLNDPVEDSYTDGAFAGAVNGTYHIDKNEAEVCGVNDLGVLKACIKIDFGAKKLYGRICVPKPFGGWKCGDWQELISW